MNKICTTIEQSRKLLELVIDINTADMCWSVDIPDSPTLLSYPITDCDNWEHKIPAWSLNALLGLMPDSAGVAKEGYCCVGYCNKYSHCSRHSNNFLDAAFELVCWLKENGKI